MRSVPLSFVLAAALLGACTSSRARSPSASPRPSAAVGHPADALAWLAGVWATDHAKDGGVARTEEYWTAPRGGMLLGAGVELEDGRLVFFEHLRIEERDGVLTYVALPNGGAAVAFQMTRSGAREVVFENPAHDYPKRIVYRMNGATLVARVDDGSSDDPRATEWHFDRVN